MPARPADVVDSDNSRTNAEWSNWYATNPQDGWRATDVLLLSRLPDPSQRTSSKPRSTCAVRRRPATSAAPTRLRRRFGEDLLARGDRAYELTSFAATLLAWVWTWSTSRP